MNKNLKSEHLRLFLSKIPKKPGVYFFYDLDGLLLYIGKAKNLQKRVSSYFSAKATENQRLSILVSQIAEIDFILVPSEKDALLLEANLIATKQPKFNVLLKDPQKYLYIKKTKGNIPTYTIVRNKENDGALYFGPFNNYKDTENLLHTLRTVFPFCTKANPQLDTDCIKSVHIQKLLDKFT